MITLSDAEARLALHAEDGSDTPIDLNLDSIRAEAVRALMLGLPITLPDGIVRQVKVAGTGLRLKRAKIEGVLNLDDVALPSGAAIPALVMEECTIPGEILLTRARVRHLSLKGSKITHIWGRGLRVEGLLNLSNLSSAEPPEATTGVDGRGLCWVELGEVQVNGSLEAESSHFVVPAKRADFRLGVTLPRNALDLEAAHITDSVFLRGETTLIGGICLANAQIGSDVWIDGAEIAAVEETAFFAQMARIGGVLMLCTRASAEGNIARVRVTGDMNLYGARIGGTMQMPGAIIDGNFSAENCTIGGDATFQHSAGQPETDQLAFPFIVSGTFVLDGAKIGGNLSLGGAILNKGMSALNVEVGANAMLCAMAATSSGKNVVARFKAADAVTLTGASVGRDLCLHGAELKGDLNAANITIGGDAYLRHNQEEGDAYCRFESESNVYLMAARIAGDLSMDGARVEKIVSAANCTIGGNVALQAADIKVDGINETYTFSAGSVDLSGTSIAGSLLIAGVEVERLQLKNIKVNDDLRLAHWFGYQKGEQKFYLLSAKKEIVLDGARITGGFMPELIDIPGELSAAVVKDAAASGRKTQLEQQARPNQSDASTDQKPAFADQPVISLRHAEVGILEDLGGRRFGSTYLLRLNGFRYATLGFPQFEPTDLQIGLQRFCERSLPVLALVSVGVVLYWLLPFGAKPGFVFPTLMWAWFLLGVCFLCAERMSGNHLGRERIKWLNRQYKGGNPTAETYSPEPYEALTQAFRKAGFYEDARQIATHRLDLERRLTTFAPLRPFVWLYGVFFDYGLSSLRASLVFVVCIIIGSAAVDVADQGLNLAEIFPFKQLHMAAPFVGKVLIIDTRTVNTVAISKGRADVVVPAIASAVSGASKPIEAIPCGNEIDPSLYALDLFVPTLDLHQESKCSVAPADPSQGRDRALGLRIWRIAGAAYAVLGWIVTALTVLTISGVLRRHVSA